MMYDDNLKQAMLAVLENRIAGIANCITALLEEGYIPNKNKYTIFDFTSILIDAYENIDILSEEQQRKLDILYNKVLRL